MLRHFRWLALAALAACITVNIHFPAAEIDEDAARIIDEVRPDLSPPPAEERAGAGEAAEDDEKRGSAGESPLAPAPKHQARAAEPGAGLLIVWAQDKPEEPPKDKEDSDDVVEAVKAALKERYPKLLPFYEQGALGETLEGLVEARDPEKLPLKSRKELERLVDAENKDRLRLYRRIATLRGIEESRLKDLQAIFGRRWIEKAKPGWWVQNEKRAWERKKAKPKPGAAAWKPSVGNAPRSGRWPGPWLHSCAFLRRAARVLPPTGLSGSGGRDDLADPRRRGGRRHGSPRSLSLQG